MITAYYVVHTFYDRRAQRPYQELNRYRKPTVILVPVLRPWTGGTENRLTTNFKYSTSIKRLYSLFNKPSKSQNLNNLFSQKKIKKSSKNN